MAGANVVQENSVKSQTSYVDRCYGALYGMFIGDALSMPVHWYYNTLSLQMDYGTVENYVAPRNPHPDSILYRSRYEAKNKQVDILHDQKKYWGKPGIHYHQFLQAGENTLNVKLARELLLQLSAGQSYSAEKWLQRMIEYLTTPGNHNDTYIEEYLRDFFTCYGQGGAPEKCGRQDEKHIGGFALMLPLLITQSRNQEEALELALDHLQLTHGGEMMLKWGKFLCVLLLNLLHGYSFDESFAIGIERSKAHLDYSELRSLLEYPDGAVVCHHFSSACYVHLSVPATIYLAMKYKNSPEKGLIANTMCGGDNCGRGAVLGAILGAINGIACWPARWIQDLADPPPDIETFLN